MLAFLSGYSNISLALGIGEIIIKSHLGEPLSAEVNITDVEKAPDANCFSDTDPIATAKPVVAISQHKQYEHSYRLTIKTHQAITEPILNLHLVHNCDPSISREYVVLLDPPQQIAAVKGYQESSVNNESPDQRSTDSTPTSTPASSSATSADSTKKTNPNKPKKSSSRAKTSSLEDQLNAIYTGATQTTVASRNKPTNKPTSDQQAEIKTRPRLSISGEDAASATTPLLPQPSLQLETQIDISRAEPLASLSTSEVMDEITSIDNRLALMKSQIISLQDKNEKLKKDAEQARMELADTMTKLRIAAGLIALLALAEWMRRRMALRRAAKAEELWFDSRDTLKTSDETFIATPAVNGMPTDIATNSMFNDDFHDKSHYGMSSGFSTTLNDSTSITAMNGHDNEDILESIDVLIEYGRYSLAIQILHDYLTNHPAESPRVWIKLFALIAAHGTEADYTSSREKSSHYYRIKLPNFAEATKTGTATLEDFPFIIKELMLAWSSDDAIALLDDLIYNKESQPEEGFEPEIFEELFLLKQIAENHDAEPDNIDSVLKNSANKEQPQAQSADHPHHLTMTSTATASALTQENDQRLPNESLARPDTNFLQAESQNQAPDSAEDSLNFDDYFTQDKTTSENSTTEVSDHYFISKATESHTFDDNQQQSDTKPALDAPEFDFSDHFKAIDEMEQKPADLIKKLDDKPQKRINKDSNLIDWVISDES